jgi:hypothetical protein
MSTEMDLMRMDERQRAAWLMANRATVFAVGLAWLGLIVWELAHERSPLFLIVMVPVFALFRVALYLYYVRVPLSPARKGGLSGPLRLIAALLLAISAFLPLFSLESGSRSAWQLVLENWESGFLVALVFLWPLAPAALARLAARARLSLVVQLGEPVLAAASTLAILWIPRMIWEFDASLLPWLWIPTPARPEIGALVAVGANGLYVIGWLARRLRRAAGVPAANLR